MKNTNPGSRTKGHEPFVIFEENRSASRLLAEFGSGSQKCGQLVYLYGPAGSGKSHLVRDTVARIRKSESSLDVVVTSGSEIAGKVHHESEAGELLSLREMFSGAQLFVCEDVQGLRGSRPAQEFLCGVLDDLRRTRANVLLTAAQLPRQLGGLNRRLASRLIAGSQVALHRPGEDSRALLLAHFAQQQQIPLAPDVCTLLARHLDASPRELAASITKLDALSRLYRTPVIDEDCVGRFLEEEALKQHVSVADIARVVARHFGLRISELRSEKRHQGVVVPRQCAMFLTRELTNTPLQTIASYFGRRTHTTVSHACMRVAELMSTQPAMRQHMNQIRQTLRAPAS